MSMRHWSHEIGAYKIFFPNLRVSVCKQLMMKKNKGDKKMKYTKNHYIKAIEPLGAPKVSCGCSFEFWLLTPFQFRSANT